MGCSIGFIPTLIFATNYFKTMIRYSSTFETRCGKYIFSFWEAVQLLLFYYSAFSVIGVAFCDMDNYPDQHTVFSSTWVFFTNAMELIQMINMKLTVYKGSRSFLVNLRVEHTEHKYLLFKLWLLLLSIFGMVNFAVLGSYVPCHCRRTCE